MLKKIEAFENVYSGWVKVEILMYYGQKCVFENPGEAFQQENTILLVKHSGDSHSL